MALADLTIQTIAPLRPLQWLKLGWRDTRRAGWASLVQGSLLVFLGIVFLAIGHRNFLLLASLVTGFLVVLPILATGLYALSRAMEAGEAPDLDVVVNTWNHWQIRHKDKTSNDYWCLVQFGALLGLAQLGWMLTSVSLITVLSPVPVRTPEAFLQFVVLANQGYLFEVWLALGGFLAAPIFASSVIAIPLLLDRQVTLKQAVLASWQVVLANPVPMALWAALLAGLTVLGFSFLMLGLIPVISILGHASWYAYRDLVDASAVPSRDGDGVVSAAGELS